MTFARSLARRIRGSLKRRVKRGLEALGVVPVATDEPEPAPVAPAAPSPSPGVPDPSPEQPVSEPVSAGLTRAAVEELLEDMVRPALQSDGGDITLVRVEPEGDVYVELVGACTTCPSATVTMRQGIERLFEAELPGFRSLIEVNGVGEAPAGAGFA